MRAVAIKKSISNVCIGLARGVGGGRVCVLLKVLWWGLRRGVYTRRYGIYKEGSIRDGI